MQALVLSHGNRTRNVALLLCKGISIQVSPSPVPKRAESALFSSAEIFFIFKIAVKAQHASRCTVRSIGDARVLLPLPQPHEPTELQLLFTACSPAGRKHRLQCQEWRHLLHFENIQRKRLLTFLNYCKKLHRNKVK